MLRSATACLSLPQLVDVLSEEVHDGCGRARFRFGPENVDRWAEQGVLLLNAVLTVRAHEAASHAGHGWERFTDEVGEGYRSSQAGGRLHAVGLVLRSARLRLSIRSTTAFSRRCTRRPCRPIGDFSAAAISAAPKRGRCQSIGREPIRW